MLHLVNGQCTLDVLEQTSIPGDKVSVDDLLMEGPLPDSLNGETAWRERAAWLQQRFGISETQYLQGARDREKVLARCSTESAVILWYENDVFCQFNFLYILQRLAETPTQLYQVCPDEDRLGTLNAGQLEHLFEQRVNIPTEKLMLARDVWKSICNGEDVSQEDFSAWPRLRSGLALYLEYQTHPQRIQMVAMNALDEGKSTLGELLCAVNTSTETKDYGLGDLQLARLILDWQEEILIEGKVDFDDYQQLCERARSWKLKRR